MDKLTRKPVVVPLPEKQKIEKVEKYLDVYTRSICVTPEEFKAVNVWTPKLFAKIEKSFALKFGHDAMSNVALTPPIIIEKQGDIKKTFQIYVIGVYVKEVIQKEVFNA